jgi:Fe2+ transport system protein FeoA
LAGCDHAGSPGTCELNRLGIGCRGFVASVSGDPDVRRRLLEMGFCNGACVEMIRRAPLGDPIEFRLRGYHLSLRNDQARFIQILPDIAGSSIHE